MQSSRILLSSSATTASKASWPALPARAAYLSLDQPQRRNALSRQVLQGLKDQLLEYNTCRSTGELKILPPFKPEVLSQLQAVQASSSTTTPPYSDPGNVRWLVDSAAWQKHRKGLPNVIVLRSAGPVFSAGHDLAELHSMENKEDVKATFALCAEVMRLIRQCPVPVVCVIQGLATAAGCQLALTCDLPIAVRGTKMRLPGATLGLPCTSPSTIVGRRFGNAFGYRMMALGDPISVEHLPGGFVEVVEDTAALERRVEEIVGNLAEKMAPRPQALAKWAYWTQAGLEARSGGDGYQDAVEWAGKVMALHAKTDEAIEGMAAFVEKRAPKWKL